MTKTFQISGPSTEVAVDSLIDEVQLIEGAHDVDVDIEAGRMTVSGEDFSSEEIERACANAGFAVEA